MAFSATVIPGHVVLEGVEQTVDMLNALGRPNVVLEGFLGASDISPGSITFAALNANLILGGTVGDEVAFTDYVIFGDASAGTNKVMQLGTFYNALLGTTTTTFGNIAIDTITYYDLGAGAPKRLTVANFLEQLVTQPADLVATANNDRVLVADVSEPDGSQAKSVELQHLMPNVGSATTVTMPTRIAVDTKGRVTAISSSDAYITSAEFPVTTAGSNSEVPHGQSSKPFMVRVVAVCKTTVGGYAVDDEIDITGISADLGGSTDCPAYVVSANATEVTVSAQTAASGQNYTLRAGGVGDWAAASSNFVFKAYMLFLRT